MHSMYSKCTLVYGTGMAVGIVLVQCVAIVYSTFLVSKFGNFAYKTIAFFYCV